MTVGTSHAVDKVRRRVPSHRGCALVALQTKFRTRFLTNVSVWIVARIAIEPVGSQHLVRVSDLLILLHAAVAAVTDLRRDSAQVPG